MLLHNKRVLILGAIFAVISLVHTPVAIFPHLFDKNAAPQFITVLIVSILFGAFLLFRHRTLYVDRLVQGALYALIAFVDASALLSGNIITSFTGDTGRYAGVATLFALALVAIFHSRLDFEGLKRLIPIYLASVLLVVVIAILQHFSIVELPGDQGVVSTFGNQDFFAAYVGVSMPLFFFLSIGASVRRRVVLGIAILISFYALVLATPLQSYVDIAFTLLGIGIYLLRRYIPRKSWNLNVRTYLGVFAVVIWAEFIFLVPFLGHWIPVLGNDMQVKIRANFWLAGMRQFFSHPLLGVGPDQYGNHYEAHRTLSDAKAYERIISNDAHASAVQTLATLGILGTLALLFFLALLIRSLLIQWDRNPGQRKHLFALGLYFFVYLTNSFVSPMAIPAKYLFWALGGWVIGQTYLKQSLRLRSIKIPVAILTATSVFILANFSVAQWRYSTAFEKYAVNQKASSDYKFNSFIPCFMYFEGKFHILENEKLDEIQTLAREQLDANPRCVSARIILAQIYQGTGDMDALEYQVSQLLEIAPYRTEVLRMGIEYANKVGDADLFNELQRRFAELGLVYVPGKDG
jgi:O-antigen ligase